MNSLFLSFDGVDGAGKSTQIDLLCDYLESTGRHVVRCRDPGSTALGEQLRSLVLGHQQHPLGMRAEMLVYMAARAQLVEEVVKPALEAGHTVVSDRFLLSNVAYQAHAGGLSIDEVWSVGHIATGGTLPDLTLVLDLDPQTAAQRRDGGSGGPDRIESRGDAFFQAVRQGFLNEAARNAEKIAMIDASRSVGEVHQQIVDAVTSRFCDEK